MGRKDRDDYGADELEIKRHSRRNKVKVLSPRRQQNQQRVNALMDENTLDPQVGIDPAHRNLYSFVDNPADSMEYESKHHRRDKKGKGSLAIPEPTDSEPESHSVQEETPSEDPISSEEQDTRRKSQKKDSVQNKRYKPPSSPPKRSRKRTTEVKKIECSDMCPCISKRCVILTLGIILLLGLIALLVLVVVLFASKGVDMRK